MKYAFEYLTFWFLFCSILVGSSMRSINCEKETCCQSNRSTSSHLNNNFTCCRYAIFCIEMCSIQYRPSYFSIFNTGITISCILLACSLLMPICRIADKRLWHMGFYLEKVASDTMNICKLMPDCATSRFTVRQSWGLYFY